MITQPTSQTNRAKARHRKHKPNNESYVHFLRTGAVAVALGAAELTGTGHAVAGPATDVLRSASDAGSAASSRTGSGTDSSISTSKSSTDSYGCNTYRFGSCTVQILEPGSDLRPGVLWCVVGVLGW